MHPNPRKIAPILLLVILGGAIYYLSRVSGAQADGPLTASGTVEAVEISLASEINGRVAEVLVSEGDRVAAGQTLARLDDSLLQAQLAQAQAALAVAQANYDLVAAGQPAEQRAAALAAAELEQLAAQQALAALHDNAALLSAQAQLTLLNAETALDAAQAALDALPDSASDEDRAKLAAALLLAAAQADLARQAAADLAGGASPDTLALAEARLAAAAARLAAAQIETPTPEQLAVAQAQVDSARAALATLETQLAKTVISAPAGGIVLERLAEPGEIALPNAPLLLLADLSRLTLTVYAPEDRYGEISLGTEVTVTVDSFPDETFTAVVTHIASAAEFTPRNVQTAEGRKTTVFAIQLTLAESGGKLKPGMPADVAFER
jgi:HlyD family secretion protein